jgi:hypothetical protein
MDPCGGRAWLVTGAHYYVLATLVRGLGLDTPLAYLDLVPLISLVVMATLGTLVIPLIRLSTFYRRWRILLLSLPLRERHTRGRPSRNPIS